MKYFAQSKINARRHATQYYEFVGMRQAVLDLYTSTPEDLIQDIRQYENPDFNDTALYWSMLFDACRKLAQKAGRINKRKFTPEQKEFELAKARTFTYFMENLEHLPTEAELFD